MWRVFDMFAFQHHLWIQTPSTAARPCWCCSPWCSWASPRSSSTSSKGLFVSIRKQTAPNTTFRSQRWRLSPRAQENPLDPRPDGGQPREGAGGDQHGRSERQHVQSEAQRLLGSERADGKRSGGQKQRYFTSTHFVPLILQLILYMIL